MRTTTPWPKFPFRFSVVENERMNRANKIDLMKTVTAAAVCCAMLALGNGAARAQDSSRVPDINQGVGATVDVSVHAGVDEQGAQPPQQHAKQPNKRQQTGPTRWAFQSENQPSATHFRHDPDHGLPAQPVKGDEQLSLFSPLPRSEAPLPADILRHSQNTPFQIAPIAGTTDLPDPHSAVVRAMLQNLNRENEVSTRGLKMRNPVHSPYLRNNTFSTPVHEKKIEPTENSTFPSPFLKPGVSNSTLLKAKPQKHNPPKSVDRSKPASSPGSPLTKQN
jgi:hypothetical protein